MAIKNKFSRSDVTIIILLLVQMVVVYTVLNRYLNNCGRCTSTNADEVDDIRLPSSHNVFFAAEGLGESTQNSAWFQYPKFIGPTRTKTSVGAGVSNMSTSTNIRSLKIIIVVFSAPENFDARLAIRGTWGTASSTPEVDMVFLLGSTSDASLQKILKEKDFYKDVVQEDFIDSHQNLTLKSIALLKWVNTFCKNAEFVLKVNDDNFVHVSNILNFLEKKESKNKVIFGKMCHNIGSSEEHRSEANVADSEFICAKQYPQFVATSAFIISQDAISDLMDAAITMDRFPMEDAFITGVCAEYSNVLRIDEARFRVTVTDLDNPCNYRKLFATVLPPFSVFAAWWYINNELFNSCDLANDVQVLTDKHTIKLNKN